VNVLLDLDGTLTDPRKGIVGCVRHALSELGEVAPSDQELARYIGPPLRDTFRELLGSDSERIEAAVGAYRVRFEAIGMFENEVYAGVPEALDALSRQGARLYLATSKPRVYAEGILRHFGLLTRFTRAYGSELNGTLSNKSELIAHVLGNEGLDCSRTIMVGDRRYDMQGAVDNRVRPVGVLWGYGSKVELLQAGATELYEKPEELARLVA
jgi:phosphoglycolate phosphatase